MDDLEDPLLLNDIALADSFINFDYEPDPVPDSDATGSGSTESGCAGGDCGGIEEGIERISLVGTECEGSGSGEVRVEVEVEAVTESERIADVESEGLVSENVATRLSSASSETSSGSDSDEKSEAEEGEIVDPDAYDDDDDEEEEEEDEEEDEDSEESSEEMASWGVLDDDAGRPVIAKDNELEVLPWVPPVNVTLGPHHQMLPVGVVFSILGAQVIVEGVEKHDPLNEGSILWMTESRRPLGFIDEIFGPVEHPYYIVRYNSGNEVPEGIHGGTLISEGIRGGTLISFVPEFANHVLHDEELYKKGYDGETSDDSEFSDDGKEAEYKRMQTMAKRGIKDQNPGKRKNNRKEVPSRNALVPTLPVAPATSLPDHGHYSSIPGPGGQGHFNASNVNPPCPPNGGPNLTTSGVGTSGTTLPQQFAVPPNGFPTNDVSWYPGNTQNSHQFPAPGIPFQQQLNSVHGYPNNTQISHHVPVPGVPFQQQLNPVHGYPGNTQISHQVPAAGVPFQQQLNPVHGYQGNTHISHQVPVQGTPFQHQSNPVHGYRDNSQISHQFPAPPGVPFQQQFNPVHGYPDSSQISHQLPVPGFPFQQQLNPVQGYPNNTQISHQFPAQGTPFQHQSNPVNGFPPATTFPGAQPNMFAQPMYAQRPVNQNQITPGLSTPFPQDQSPTSFISGNQHAPRQFNPGPSTNYRRQKYHRPSKRGWRPGK